MVETDYPKLNHRAYNPVLMTSTFGPTSNVVYLQPFEVADLWDISATNLAFKFGYTGLGTQWSFSFRLGLYRLERGIGGTASTWVKIFDFGVTVKTYLSDPATGTVYNLASVPIFLLQGIKSGIYAMAFQWQDTSNITIPPSRCSWTSYGATLPSYAGWFYYADGSNTGSLPATITALGAATTFQIYWEAK